MTLNKYFITKNNFRFTKLYNFLRIALEIIIVGTYVNIKRYSNNILPTLLLKLIIY